MFLLVRVDDRLLHGQVVLGWGLPLRPRAYLLADDRVAGDPWEIEAYRSAVPAGTSVEAWELGRLGRDWDAIEDPAGTIVLLRGLRQLAGARAAGFRPPDVINLGGMHAAAGSRGLLAYLHLDEQEVRLLGELLEAGVEFYAQELPGAPRVDGKALREMLDRIGPGSTGKAS